MWFKCTQDCLGQDSSPGLADVRVWNSTTSTYQWNVIVKCVLQAIPAQHKPNSLSNMNIKRGIERDMESSL